MSHPAQPSEIAREALHQMALRRVAPTPDNYRALYHEIAGVAAASDWFPEKALRAICGSLPRATPEQLRFARQLDAAVVDHDWATLRRALVTLSEGLGNAPQPWGASLRDLLVQVDACHEGLTREQKRSALEHVLESCGENSQTLLSRIQGLTRSWAEYPKVAAGSSPEGIVGSASADTRATANASAASETYVHNVQHLIAHLLERTGTALQGDHSELAGDAATLAGAVRASADARSLNALGERLGQFAARLQWAVEDQSEIKDGMLRLLQLLIDNVGELAIDDEWLHGQVSMLREEFSGPINLGRLEDLERHLTDVIRKQSAMKNELTEARERIKSMLAGFVEHLASVSATTGDYGAKLGVCAERISSAADISELGEVVEQVMQETRSIQVRVESSHSDMQGLRQRVNEADEQIRTLQNQLAQASELVRVDHLTGTLNRKGMDEAMEREMGRARRRGAPLSVAILDVDNFKQLNDTHGHLVGDEALVHLANVVRKALRGQDSVSRYGGEEFVILLPDTELANAVTVLIRLQRELTKTYFMREQNRVLITFSAGVTQMVSDETKEASLARADGAMYQAKRAGKNRVIAAPVPAAPAQQPEAVAA
ncbi:MAG: diguanylate cyclase [Betaproteobacteria bacterium]|nr:diguanylate cyclase [Betaproteobacteria bacterium]